MITHTVACAMSVLYLISAARLLCVKPSGRFLLAALAHTQYRVMLRARAPAHFRRERSFDPPHWRCAAHSAPGPGELAIQYTLSSPRKASVALHMLSSRSESKMDVMTFALTGRCRARGKPLHSSCCSQRPSWSPRHTCIRTTCPPQARLRALRRRIGSTERRAVRRSRRASAKRRRRLTA